MSVTQLCLADLLKLKGFTINGVHFVGEDERGAVWRVDVGDGRERILSYTVKNEVRGGYRHDTNHHMFVLKGRVFWITKECLHCSEGHGLDQNLMRENEEYVTPTGTPHMMVSIGEPSLILEWVEALGPYQQEPFEEFRKQVEAQKE